MGNQQDKNYIVIFGLGIFGEKILESLSKDWAVIGVDIDQQKIEKLKERFRDKGDITLITADASSILTWKKLPLQSISYIISTVRDFDITLEICRIAREVFELDIPILAFVYEEENLEKIEKYNVEIINPIEIVKSIVLSKIERNFKTAINIGLGKGEIIQVDILARSHLVDRKLKYLKPSRWRIAAIYRDGELIIPDGEERIKVGDKVVIIGDPKVLENLVNILLKGIPQFPLQFGENFATVYHKKYKRDFEETAYLKKNTKANKLLIYPYRNYNISDDIEYIKEVVDNFEIKQPVSEKAELFQVGDSIGVVGIPFEYKPVIGWFYLRNIFKRATKPFLLTKGSFPYKGIVVSLNTPEPAYTLEMGMELSRMLRIPVEAIFGVMPEELRGVEEEEALKERNSLISDFERIYRQKIGYYVFEGNPVKESVKFLQKKENILLVVSYDKGEKIGLFNPVVPFYLTKDSPSSVLCFPLGEGNG
ncbi:MAG: hypothetical protein GXO45_02990 [Aquificae bacterium]|nr:hypothetical protein [Aquificota bacterium]